MMPAERRAEHLNARVNDPGLPSYTETIKLELRVAELTSALARIGFLLPIQTGRTWESVEREILRILGEVNREKEAIEPEGPWRL